MSQFDPLSQKPHWEQAGQLGYASAYFQSQDVERHIWIREWSGALDIAHQIELGKESKVLDLGCGDGTFSNQVLSKCFAGVDGFDFSEAGIKRANAEAAPGARFRVLDLRQKGLRGLPKYDGAFLVGILHHVKKATPLILRELSAICPRVVVIEPNGDNIMRKLLEFTPAYRAAGEDSFRTKEIPRLFDDAGYRLVCWRRMNLFPNFTPGFLFQSLRFLEPTMEKTKGLRALCTMNTYGFVLK